MNGISLTRSWVLVLCTQPCRVWAFLKTNIICYVVKGIRLRVKLRNWTDHARVASSRFRTKCFKTSHCEEKNEKNYFQSVRMSTKTFGSYELYFYTRSKWPLTLPLEAHWDLKGIAIPMLILRVMWGPLVKSKTLLLYPREKETFPIERAAMWAPWQVRTSAGISSPPGFETWTFQPAASPYTVYPVPSYL
jgi:hypothetical protein